MSNSESIEREYENLCDSFDDYQDENLRALPYHAFIQSGYWNIVRNYKLLRADYRCELCESPDKLHVHHQSYEHHGREHEYLGDLIVVCAICHDKIHSKLWKRRNREPQHISTIGKVALLIPFVRKGVRP
jgi:hypothetical protein